MADLHEEIDLTIVSENARVTSTYHHLLIESYFFSQSVHGRVINAYLALHLA